MILGGRVRGTCVSGAQIWIQKMCGGRTRGSLIKAQTSFSWNELYLEDESSSRVVSCGNQKVLKPWHSRSEKVIDWLLVTDRQRLGAVALNFLITKCNLLATQTYTYTMKTHTCTIKIKSFLKQYNMWGTPTYSISFYSILSLKKWKMTHSLKSNGPRDYLTVCFTRSSRFAGLDQSWFPGLF